MGLFGAALLLTLVCYHRAQGQIYQGPGRIVNGRDAKQEEAPYQLSMQLANGFHFCGASLVQIDNVQFAISAAHCVEGFDSSYPGIFVVAGELDMADVSGIEQYRQVGRIATHPEWDMKLGVNDIAILFWKEPFETSANVSTIPLPTPEAMDTPLQMTVTGWGELQFGGQVPNVLQLVEIPVVKDDICQDAWGQVGVEIRRSMICAGTSKGDISPCRGDSGGPGINSVRGDLFLAGVVSFGLGCGHPDFPDVFTEVAYFLDWIKEQVAVYKVTG